MLETSTNKKQAKNKLQIIEQQSLSFEQIDKTSCYIVLNYITKMNATNLIESFSEFKEFKNIDRETMMNILEDVFRSVA